MKNFHSLLGKLALIATVTLGSSQVLAQMSPANVTIRSISYAGSGCPAGSVSQNLAPDFKAFTLLFDSFIASVGPAEPISQKRKNCQINVDFSFPQGWTYALVSFDYRGFVDVERDVIGLQQTSYYFQGAPQTARFKTSMPGPVSRDYQVRDALDLTATVWSPCGESRSLNINSEVRLDNTRNRNGRGLITVDSVDGNIAHTYGIAWKRCW